MNRMPSGPGVKVVGREAPREPAGPPRRLASRLLVERLLPHGFLVMPGHARTERAMRHVIGVVAAGAVDQASAILVPADFSRSV